jgi:hypothetical protein
MGLLDSVLDTGKGLSEIYKDIKTADAVSKDGLARTGVLPETIADQTSVGVQSPAGFHGAAQSASTGAMSILGVQVSAPIITGTVLLIGGILAVKALK